MKEKLLLFFVLVLMASCVKQSVDKSKNLSYVITFADCFKGDTVSFSINGLQAFDKIILHSDFSTGLTKSGVYYNKKTEELLIVENWNRRKGIPFPLTESLDLIVNKNGVYYRDNLKLSKGKYITIEGCESKILIHQYKRPLSFE